MKNYYEILGVSIDADEVAIRESYRKLARIYHPDVSKSDTKEKMQEIIEAYAVLGDPKKREEYDRTLKIIEYSKEEHDEAVSKQDFEYLDRKLLLKKRELLRTIEKRFSFFGLSRKDFYGIFKDIMDNQDKETK